MIVNSAEPTTLNGASLTKTLNKIESHVGNGYTLKSITVKSLHSCK